MKRKERVEHLIEEFLRLYPQAHCELNYSNALELLVATILSAQCTDVRVNKVTPALFKRCRNVREYKEIPSLELEKLIYSTGFFRSKAKAIQGSATVLFNNYGGKIPRSLKELSALPGVGRKTANVVLSNAFNIHEGIVVDTHVRRLSKRLGLTKANSPQKIEEALMKLFERQYWGVLSHWFIWHGRRVCRARHPDCESCTLHSFCPSAYQPHRFLRKL